MANEPERPIEKLLRAYAKKRREAGEDFALHPVNRRRLQKAVAEKFGQEPAERGGWGRWLPIGWLRLAWGAAAVAVVLVAAVLWLPSRTPSKPELLLARNEPLAQPRPAAAPEPARSPTPAAPAEQARKKTESSDRLALAENTRRDQSKETLREEKQRQLADKDQSLAAGQLQAGADFKLDALAPANQQEREGTDGLAFSKRVPATAPTVAAAPPRSSSISSFQKEKASGPVAANEVQNAPAATAAAPALGLTTGTGSTPAGTSAGLLAGDAVTQKPGQYHFFADEANVAKKPAAATERFARSLSVAAEAHGDKAATTPVLNAFTLEQSGRQLRVVDSDGSVYTGYLDVAENTKSLRSDGVAGTLATRAFQAPIRNRESSAQSSPQPYSAAYFFRVTGTNQTLKQPVIFSGNLLPATNQVSAALSTNVSAGGYGGGGAISAGRTMPLPLPARISGTATIGSNQTPIEATTSR